LIQGPAGLAEHDPVHALEFHGGGIGFNARQVRTIPERRLTDLAQAGRKRHFGQPVATGLDDGDMRSLVDERVGERTGLFALRQAREKNKRRFRSQPTDRRDKYRFIVSMGEL
jgi:hypothetical protein